MSHQTRWNPDSSKDPILKSLTTSRKEMAQEIGKILDGADAEGVINVLSSSLLNVLRQVYPKRREAENALNHLNSLMLQCMDKHYHPGPHGKRRSLFPFDQVLNVPYFGKIGEA